MKNKAFIFTVLALILGFQVNADVWRVNNRTIINKTVTADFTTLQDAIDDVNVLANDTLYLAGSPTSYGNGTFAKPLVVIGTGYFLTENDTTQAYQNPSRVGRLVFAAGSEGSVVMGVYIYYEANINGLVNSVYVNADSITLKKNRIYAYNTYNYQYVTAYAINLTAGIQDIHIGQNFITTRLGNSSARSRGINMGTGVKCVVNNNIFRNNNPYTVNRYAIISGY